MLLRSHRNKSVREKLEEFLKERMVWQKDCYTIIGYLYLYIDSGSKQTLKSIRTGKVLFIQISDCVGNVFYFNMDIIDKAYVTHVKKYNNGVQCYSSSIRAFQNYYFDFIEGPGVQRIFEDKYVVSPTRCIFLNTPYIKASFR